MNKSTLIALVLAIVALLALLYGAYDTIQKQKTASAAELAIQSGDYEREIDVLRKTANDLRATIETAPATSGATIRYVTKYRDRTESQTVTTSTDLPAECITCLLAVEIPYHFETSYVVLDDVLRFNETTLTFESIDRTFKLTDAFNERVVTTGVGNFVDEDTELLQARLGAIVGYALPGMSVGAVVEFVNLEGIVGFDAGINAGVLAIPNDPRESFAYIGLDWRTFRNAAVTVGYGRSLAANLLAAGIVFFPFD